MCLYQNVLCSPTRDGIDLIMNFWATALCYRTVVLSVCNVRALWPNGWTDQHETWHAGRPRSWPHCVRWEPSSPAQFSAHICCGQMAAWIKMPLGMELRLGPGDCLRWEPPPSQTGQSPQFSAHVYCGQTAGWIKMALDMEVGLGPGHIVLGGDPAPLSKRGPSPQFSAHFYCDQTAGCMRRCVRWESQLPIKGAQPPSFRFMSVLAKRLDG